MSSILLPPAGRLLPGSGGRLRSATRIRGRSSAERHAEGRRIVGAGGADPGVADGQPALVALGVPDAQAGDARLQGREDLVAPPLRCGRSDRLVEDDVTGDPVGTAVRPERVGGRQRWIVLAVLLVA